MNQRRLDDLAVLIAVLALPVGCVDRDGTTSASVGDTAGSGDTAAQTDATSSSESAGTSGDVSTTEVSGTTGGTDPTIGESTTGSVESFCEAYGAKLAECFPDTMTVEEATAGCIDYIEQFGMRGQDCLDVLLTFLMCESIADCAAHQAGDPCFDEQTEVQKLCAMPPDD